MSETVLPMNKELVRALSSAEISPEPDPLVSLLGALRLCKNDAEVELVVRKLFQELIDYARSVRNPETYAWHVIDCITRAVDLQPVKITYEQKQAAAQPIHFSDDDKRKFHEAMNSLNRWQAEERRRHAGQGLHHVPLGFLELFESLREAGVKNDFQRDLDDHLRKLLDLYVDESEGRVQVSVPTTIDVIKSLAFEMLDIVEETLTTLEPEAIQKRIEESGIASEESGFQDNLKEAFSAYVVAVCAINRYAIDFIYCDNVIVEDLTQALVDRLAVSSLMAQILRESIPVGGSMRVDQPTDLSLANSRSAGVVAGHVYSWVLLSVLEPNFVEDPWSARVAGALALCTAPELLFPRFRSHLLEILWDPLIHQEAGALNNYFESSLILKLGAASKSSHAEVVRDIAIAVVSAGLRPACLETFEEEAPGAMLMRSLNLHATELSFEETLSDLDALVAWARQGQITFPDDSDLSSEIEASEQYWALLDRILWRFRAFPCESDMLRNRWGHDTSLNEAYLEFYLFEEGNEVPFPAIISVSRYLYAVSEGFGTDHFFPALDACIEEGLYLTASKILNYYIVTNIPRVPERKENSEFSTKLNRIAEAIIQLRDRISMDATVEAIRVGSEMYKDVRGIKENDYFSDVMDSLVELGGEKVGVLVEEPERKWLRTPYRDRIKEISKGASENWPSQILDRVVQIEQERAFNLSGSDQRKSINDYPWVVSYHKIPESLLREKLAFLYDKPWVEILQQANKNDKLRGFEPFKVLRLLERAALQPKRYQVVIEELEIRGVSHVDALQLMRDYMSFSRLRNIQAHSVGPLDDANRHRDWLLVNLHRILSVFNIGALEVRQALSS